MFKPKATPSSKEELTKVLVIDDEPSFTRMIKLNLESTGRFEVKATSESRLAIEICKDFLPDIVLLDVVMPELDGGDIAREIRSRSAIKDTPIIFVSAMVSQKESNSGFYQSGGENFLAKPVDKDTLCGAIESALSKK